MQYGALILCTSALMSGSTAVLAAPQGPSKITEHEIKVFINGRAGVDLCDSLDQIHIDHLEYFDFMGTGQQQAVVVASTCNTGTAGPDVHAVYARNARGELVELPFLGEAGGFPPPSNVPVFGNPNYELTVENRRLIAKWRDSSERENPAVARYRWDGKQFVFDRMDVEGPYPTSYDCAKATSTLDRAICYTPNVAALDLQLGQIYRSLMEQLPPGRTQQLQNQQRAWLAEREKRCVIYKTWVDCLTDMYIRRIAVLKQLKAGEHSLD